MIGLAACFGEDEMVIPHTPGDEQTFTYNKSIYTTQSFFDLGTNSIVEENPNGEWILRFASQAGDWHVGINSADYWAVYNSGSSDPDSVQDNPVTGDWNFDSSSGEPDSTAFAGWILFTEEDTIYSNIIYLLGKYDGIRYTAVSALQLLSVDESGYSFRLKDWPAGDWMIHTALKDPSYNYQYMSNGNGVQWLQVEPPREMWDLQFTQYGSILFTDDGIPTPYYVRGTLLNRNGVMAALDSVNSFADISFEDISGYDFSSRADIIGHEWKSVEVDVNSNTAVYTVNTDYTYIIKDSDGFYYKLRFISYYNDLGQKGFPVFEHIRL